MSETVTAAEKTLRQWYQGKLAERMMQAASLERNRNLLRRGARKMQDGTLGEARAADGGEEEPVNIHIGDQVFTTGESAAKSEASGPITIAAPEMPSGPAAAVEALAPVLSAGASNLAKLATAAALIGAGGGAGLGASWLFNLFQPPPAVEVPAMQDTDVQYELHLGDPVGGVN